MILFNVAKVGAIIRMYPFFYINITQILTAFVKLALLMLNTN